MSAESTDRQVALEMYKLTVEMADRVSSRRASANSFFLTLHTALAAFVGVIGSASEADSADPLPPIDSLTVICVSAAGMVLASAWWILLRSYRDLNTAKFEVINRLEQDLPIRPFSDEWASLKSDPVKRWRPRYAELGFVERTVPIVFVAIYAVLGLRVVF